MGLERSLERKAPWFSGLWAEALGYMRKDHSLAEAALGIAGMLKKGEIAEAERIYRTQIQPQLFKRRAGNFSDAETDSTQLKAMISSGIYPKSMCEEIERNLK